MSSAKPSRGSGCLSIVIVIIVFSVIFAMCSGGDNVDPTMTTNPSTSLGPHSSHSAPSSTAPSSTAPTTTASVAPSQSTPTAPSTTAAASFEFLHWPETISRNNTAKVTIKGLPNTKYSITVYYKSGASSASGLESKISDADGYVTWTWKIGPKTSPGTFRIVVSGGGSSETVYFTITE